VILGIGKPSNLFTSCTRYIGDPANPISFMVERYYDERHSVDQLAILATHAVVQAGRFNSMVSGLTAVLWREGKGEVNQLNDMEYIAKSQALEQEMMGVVAMAMGVARSR
jgi:hypothetical protein